jgi:hypothetical protein
VNNDVAFGNLTERKKYNTHNLRPLLEKVFTIVSETPRDV